MITTKPPMCVIMGRNIRIDTEALMKHYSLLKVQEEEEEEAMEDRMKKLY